jgi:hypothetical protein
MARAMKRLSMNRLYLGVIPASRIAASMRSEYKLGL